MFIRIGEMLVPAAGMPAPARLSNTNSENLCLRSLAIPTRTEKALLSKSRAWIPDMQRETSRPRIMPTLTTLPISILKLILRHLCDDRLYELRSSLQGTTSFLPYGSPEVCHTLDHADLAHAVLPEKLLAPALASPILAAAAVGLIGHNFSYLTFLNTEGRLPLWVHAFARYVKAVITGVVAEKWHPRLPRALRELRLNKICESTVDMFKEITVNYARLKLLDLVHVPFDECGAMQDDLMSGLCTTLESSHTTLRELALPVYLKSDLCACALEMVTLPHLVVFSMELMNVRDPQNVSDRRRQRLRRPFLKMMQAVDGHADRSCGLTTLVELRLINVYKVPCISVWDSWCSTGLFRAVRMLRVAGNISVTYASAEELSFFALFRKLECLYWNGMPDEGSCLAFEFLCEKLREVHLCHLDWITGVQVGVGKVQGTLPGRYRDAGLGTYISCHKLITLATHDKHAAHDLVRTPGCCPKLEHLSLYATAFNLVELRKLIKKCELLTSLEIIVTERPIERLEGLGWLELAKAIPRHHAHLCDIAIKTKSANPDYLIPVDAVIDCFVDVVKRLGLRANRLVFRAGTRSRRTVKLINSVCRILETCQRYAWFLGYLEIDLVPRFGRKSYDIGALLDASRKLRTTKETYVSQAILLGKLDLGHLHSYSNSR